MLNIIKKLKTNNQRDLNGFQFSQSPVNEEQVRALHEGHFIEQKRNIVLVGGTGSGKSHLAIAIASQVVKNGRKARFFNVVDLRMSPYHCPSQQVP